jgi:hypothetical protein
VAKITEKLNKQCYVDPNENKKYRGKLLWKSPHQLHLRIYYISKLLNTSEIINTINSRHMLSHNTDIILFVILKFDDHFLLFIPKSLKIWKKKSQNPKKNCRDFLIPKMFVRFV